MTATRRQTVFAGLDPPGAWPQTPRALRPQRLETGLDSLPGVAAATQRKLGKLGLASVRDVLEHRPRRYETAADEVAIAALRQGEEVVVSGRVLNVEKRPMRGRRRTRIVARVDDGTAAVSVTWFNQPWLADRLKPGTEVRLRGKLGRFGFEPRSYDIGDEARATADFAPVYAAAEEIAAATVRRVVDAALPLALHVPDPLPAELREREGLALKRDALAAVHRPRDLGEAETGRQRLAFEELLILQIGIARRAAERERTLAPALGEPGDLIHRYRKALPFALTPYQEQAIREIDGDLGRTVPMQRLLQGDVGSGKTVVAVYALLPAVGSGGVGALMAPTETPAEQRFLTLDEPCRQLGVSCALLTGSVKHDVNSDIVVGTHALIQKGVQLPNLAVAVVDEQHRFGVEQRRALTEAGSPHVLHMTATPIPRTLALTLYGNLSVSEIAKPPANRKPVITAWVTQEKSGEAYARLRKHLDAGRQAYVVCPLIEESETSQARAAEAEAERLRRAELRGYRVGLLHGRLRPADRRELMARFKAHELDVLVATTVIEVGVDVPNATIMIVQEADRFGLAQLHQLRGRVGRGAEQSYCLLVSRAREDLTETAARRLEALVRTTDGFELAEEDLEIRGGGQLRGTRQSGLTDLKFAQLRKDRPLLERARELADDLVDVEGPLRDAVEHVDLSGG